MCYHCNTPGYLSYNCLDMPEEERAQRLERRAQRRIGRGFLQMGYSLTQTGTDESEAIDPNWILLDTCSTDNVFKNARYVRNIHKCREEDELRIITNGGHVDYNEEAEFTLLPTTVHFNSKSIANVLSFKKVSEIPGVRITTDTSKEKAFYVHSKDGSVMKFLECKDGLYFYNPADVNIKNKSDVITYSTLPSNKNIILVSTVEDNKKFYTKKQVDYANIARKLQQDLSWPSTPLFKKMINTNFILNSKISTDDVNRALKIFGPPEPLLRGTMVAPSPVTHRNRNVPIPVEILRENNKLRLYCDICFINGMPFIVTRTDIVEFMTVHHLRSRKRKKFYCF